MTVREATFDDVPNILDMGERFVAGNGWPVPFDRAHTERTVRWMIEDENAAIFVADGGMVSGLVFPHYFNGDMSGQEMWWWVEPSKRNTSLGPRLIATLESWAKRKGAKTFSVVALASRSPERMAQFYSRHGYTPTEQHFMRVL